MYISTSPLIHPVAFRWSHPFDGMLWGHYLRELWDCKWDVCMQDRGLGEKEKRPCSLAADDWLREGLELTLSREGERNRQQLMLMFATLLQTSMLMSASYSGNPDEENATALVVVVGGYVGATMHSIIQGPNNPTTKYEKCSFGMHSSFGNWT